jgi:hypothetical protein
MSMPQPLPLRASLPPPHSSLPTSSPIPQNQRFPVQSYVTVHGLTSAGGMIMNGKRGIVTGKPAASGRVSVLVDGQTSDAAIKEDNLVFWSPHGITLPPQNPQPKAPPPLATFASAALPPFTMPSMPAVVPSFPVPMPSFAVPPTVAPSTPVAASGSALGSGQANADAMAVWSSQVLNK